MLTQPPSSSAAFHSLEMFEQNATSLFMCPDPKYVTEKYDLFVEDSAVKQFVCHCHFVLFVLSVQKQM